MIEVFGRRDHGSCSKEKRGSLLLSRTPILSKYSTFLLLPDSMKSCWLRQQPSLRCCPSGVGASSLSWWGAAKKVASSAASADAEECSELIVSWHPAFCRFARVPKALQNCVQVANSRKQNTSKEHCSLHAYAKIFLNQVESSRMSGQNSRGWTGYETWICWLG